MDEQKDRKLWSLFTCFFRIGAFTFGGGYAMIPLIEKEVVDKKHWLTGEDILDIVAIAESTPGPIAVNAATFVGYHTAGLLGAMCATLGVVLPAFTIIAIISTILRQFQSVQAVKYAFFGIRAGVLALIVKALISMYKKCPKHLFSYCVMGASFVAAALVKVPVLAIIIGCAVAGVVMVLCAGKGGLKRR